MVERQTVIFLQKILEKLRLHTHLVHPDRLSGETLDLGLRRLLGLQEEYQTLLQSLRTSAQHNTIYRYTDRFFCSYFFLFLPDSHEALIAGPYTAFSVTKTHLLEKSEFQKIPPQFFTPVEQFYAQLPVIPDSVPLLNLFTSFGEVIWGGNDAFRVDFSEEVTAPLGEHFLQSPPVDSPLFDMQLMEERYHFENQLMEMVSHGQLHRLEAFSDSLSPKMFESRIADPVRNVKNYCIICNTLLRKAAERGGVHPFYLDRMSSDFAVRIETVHSPSAGIRLLHEILQSYCRLVRKHSSESYSPPVRKAVLLVENDLTRDLSLSSVAKELAVSPAYLSALFAKETGRTFSQFVMQQRMAYGKHLLETTHLQVQTIALHCGISDVNYFSKCFKKQFGITPRALRK